MKSLIGVILIFACVVLQGKAQNSVIQGQVTYANSFSTPLAGITVSLLNAADSAVLGTTTTTISGFYYFNITNSGDYLITASTTAAPAGFNSADALLTLKHYVNISHLTGIYLKAANVDNNSVINTMDALYIQKRFNSSITTFPRGNWYFGQVEQTISTPGIYTVNIQGICYGDVNGSHIPASIPGSGCPNLPAIVYSGQIYNTVQIGMQCWMRENLNIGTYVSSTNTGIGHSDASNNGIIEKYCLNNNQANCNVYGGLYDWNELMQYTTLNGTQGICPSNWHVATDQEWCTLATYLDPTVDCSNIGPWMGVDAGGKLKETGTTHWLAPNTGATNSSGFYMLGGGQRINDGSFAGLNEYAVYWSSSNSSPQPFYWYIQYNEARVGHKNLSYRENGFSVRCIKDTCIQLPTSASAGPDQLLIGDSTTLQANTPQYGTGTWSILSGTGGSISEIHNPVTGFTGIAPNTYYLVWTISTGCTQSRDTVSITFQYPPMGSACSGIPTFTYGGQTYNTVQIGNQCWMKENLNIGTFVTSTSTGGIHSNMSNNGIIEKYCLNNLQSNCAIYGGLYDWRELMQYTSTSGTQGICPSGWHIPTDEEFCTLSTYIDPTFDCGVSGTWSGINAGGKLKETGTLHWTMPNVGATNETGFTMLGSGERGGAGGFAGIGSYAIYWTSTNTSSNPYYWYTYYNDARIYHYNQSYPENGWSIRCIKN